MIKFINNPVDKISISSPYAYRTHPFYNTRHHHSGNDLRPLKKGVDGDSIYSVADGTVVVSKVNGGGVNKGYGYYVIIDHGEWCTLYAHLMGLDVSVGKKVKAGDVIGRMGNTGTSTGTHLHFSVYNHSYSSLFFQDDNSGKDYYSVNPDLYYVSDKKQWDEILQDCLDEPNNWIKCIDSLKEIAEMNSNLGDFEIMKYVDSLIEKVYEFGKNS